MKILKDINITFDMNAEFAFIYHAVYNQNNIR